MNYEQLRKQVLHGWNTYNSNNVLSHVLLPYGFCINLCIKEYSSTKVLREAMIGRFGEAEEHIHPCARSYDGSYTRLRIHYLEMDFIAESTTNGDDQFILLKPVGHGKRIPSLIVEGCLLWNKPGFVGRKENYLEGIFDKTVRVYINNKSLSNIQNVHSLTPYLSVDFDEPIVISTKADTTLEEVQHLLTINRKKMVNESQKYGELAEAYNAMRTGLAWDTIYEPQGDQICTPVSRIWNKNWGGYVLFNWDTFFVAIMAGADNKELAYMNLFAIVREQTEAGFIPNYGAAHNYKSRDRSEPPVASMACLTIYRKYQEKWILDELFPALLSQNTWFYEHRRTEDNLLCWGSDPFDPVNDAYWEKYSINCLESAALESGLDNSPMYDGQGFNKETHLMELADVGLTSLFIMDCECLAAIATILQRKTEAECLTQRAESVKDALSTLWSKEKGIFLNKNTVTGEFSDRISPTNFYALLSDKVTDEQARRMMDEHFYNPKEFWGNFIIPSIARNDPAYKDQNYWRGRIWGPMNFLVYLSLKKHGLVKECNDLAKKSENLLLQEWNAHGHIHENYSGNDGWGCGVGNSDKFYHWGALLALIALMDQGMY